MYNISIRSYSLAVKLAGFFGNQKAKKWITGRKNWRTKIADKIGNSSSKIIWIHATSLGEFDQVKPLIEKIKEDSSYSEFKIVITFFSPSGYEYSKDYDLADHIFYLPSDTKKNAADFIQLIKPDIAIFVKYDFWFNYLTTLQDQNIPILYFSCNFRKNQIYFKKSSEWQLEILRKVNKILTLNASSQELLKKHNFNNTDFCGDTRFDKVVQNANRCKPLNLIEKFKEDKTLLILGSSWEKEESLLAVLLDQFPNWNEQIKIVVAPHNIYEKHVKEIESKLNVQTLKYSDANDDNINKSDLLIIDNIGMLSNLYQYGDISFIGGGFTNKLHNILEAATFGNVVLFGNNHAKFPEAKMLLDFGGGIELKDENGLVKEVKLLLDNPEKLATTKSKAKRFIRTNTGATDIVFTEFQKLIQ